MSRYDILGLLGVGGMGEVSLARLSGEHGFEKLVALKRVLPARAGDEQLESQFVSEAKLAVSLRHANLVQVLDLARQGPDLYLVMEYVEGADLARLLAAKEARRERLPAGIAMHLALESLKGLAYAHEQTGLGPHGVVHCDISPSNLLVSFAGEVKIADFGVAELVRGQRRVMGKARYMAPEQARGEPLDGRADLYSLSAVLFEALAGRPPFDFSRPEEVAQHDGRAPKLERWRPDLPLELSEYLECCLSAKRQYRPASARAMLQQMTALSRRVEPTTAPDVGTWARESVHDAPSLRAPERRGHPAPRASASVRAASAAPVRTMTLESTVLTEVSTDGVSSSDPSPRGQRVPPPLRSSPMIWAAAAAALVVVGWGVGRAFLSSSPTTAMAPHPQPGAAELRADVAAPPPPPAPSPSPSPATAPAKPPATSEELLEQPQRATPVVRSEPVDATASRSRRPPARAGQRRAEPRQQVGFLSVFSEPWAEVLVDGKRVGVSPLKRVAVPIGRRRVELVNPARQRVERVVLVRPGETELLDVELAQR